MRAWKLISHWGIAHDDDPDDVKGPFHAGILVDALRMRVPPHFPLLAASNSSGVWLVNEEGGIALPLSFNWNPPGINCLARGFYREEHVYAGGGSLWETDVNTAAPLLKWNQISLILPNGTRANVGLIYRVLVVPRQSALVLATATGIWWARIPGTPGGTYSVTQAPLLPGLPFSGLAAGPNNKVVAACWGTDYQNNYGIYVGDWTGPGNALQFGPRAAINGIDQRRMLRVELASCESQRNVLYAVAGGSNVKAVLDNNGNTIPHPNTFGWVAMTGDDFILAVLRSNDGGNTWDRTGSAVDDTTVPLFPGSPTQDLGGHTQGGFNLVVGVSPFTPDVVGVGLVHGFISTNGGKSWAMFSEKKHRHPHPDVHACYFDPLDANTMHACTDGGIASTRDLGGTWRSAANRQLANFQIHRFAVSRPVDGLSAMSLQDNGDVAAPLYPNADPWRPLPEAHGGDGILSMFTDSGNLIHHNNTEFSTDSSGAGVEYGAKPRACEWDPMKRRFSHLQMFPNYPLKFGVIPIDGTNDGLIANANNANDIEAIERPSWMNALGESMQAVGAEGEKVYGLFQKSDGKFHWQQLGAVPHKPNLDANGVELPYFPGAIASLDGRRIVVGMNNGLIFLLDAPTWAVTEISDPAISASVTRIAHIEHDDILIIADMRAFRWSPTGWTMLPAGPPPALPAGFTLKALAVDRTAYPPRLFIANDVGVWQSDSNGSTWFQTNVGLPLVPYSMDLRTSVESSGAAFVYLATWGWSVFRLLTNLDDTTQVVIIDGFMDIVDRQPVDDDIWGHPKFTRIAILGPLHPFEEYTINGDNGDEVKVELKIKCAWKSDKTVDVRYSAKLIDMGSDDEVTDTEGETLRIAFFGQTQTIAFDMDSDEWWPDRAHVQFTVQN